MKYYDKHIIRMRQVWECISKCDALGCEGYQFPNYQGLLDTRCRKLLGHLEV